MLNQLLKPVLERLPENNWLERLWILAKVDFWKRYYNSRLGVVWAFINPLMRFVIYFFFFTYIYENRIPEFGFYLFSGLIFWMFFSEGTVGAINVYNSKRYLLESIQINKFDLNLASAFSSLFGFLFNFTAYFLIQIAFGPPITWNALFIPILMINMFIIILGLGALLATLNIYLKDIAHVWDIVMLAGFFTHPIFFTIEMIEGVIPIAKYLSPMVGILFNSREVLVYGRLPDMGLLVYDLLYALVIVGIGIFVSRKYSHKVLEKI